MPQAAVDPRPSPGLTHLCCFTAPHHEATRYEATPLFTTPRLAAPHHTSPPHLTTPHHLTSPHLTTPHHTCAPQIFSERPNGSRISWSNQSWTVRNKPFMPTPNACARCLPLRLRLRLRLRLCLRPPLSLRPHPPPPLPPRLAGLDKDSKPEAVKKMQKRSHVLYKMIDPFVHRQTDTILKPFLPPKQEVRGCELTEPVSPSRLARCLTQPLPARRACPPSGPFSSSRHRCS